MEDVYGSRGSRRKKGRSEKNKAVYVDLEALLECPSKRSLDVLSRADL